MDPSGWAYLDDRRTHEVRVSVQGDRDRSLVIRESAFGSDDPRDAYVETHPLRDPWDEKLRVLALETRLAGLGTYYKSTPLGWIPVRLAQAGEAPDLAPMDLDEGSGGIEFHHFLGEDRSAASLVAVHQGEGAARRSLLVRLDYQFPDTDGGNLDVVHARLPPALFRSALASQHLDLAARRFRKAPRDQRRMVEARTWAALRAALDAILSRLVQTCEDAPDALRDATGRPLDATALVLVHEAARSARGAASRTREYEVDFEVDLPSEPVEGRPPDVLIEELSGDVLAALNEPRLVDLQTRFLAPPDEADLFARGERAIHLHMRYLRERARPDERHLVSLVEARVLLRYALSKRIPVDPNVIKRVKHARAYM